MKNSVFVLVLCLACLSGYGQNIYSLQDPVSSRFFSAERYSTFKGSPYIIADWVNGSATTSKGTYGSLQLKFSVPDNTLLFAEDEKAYELVDEVLGFTLKPEVDNPATYLVFKRGVEGPDFNKSAFVQVLAEGKASFYKLHQKQVTENIQINAGMVKTFVNNAKYYISNNGVTTPVKLQKETVLAALSDKQAQVQSFIEAKKLNLKKEADVTQLLAYYNTL